MPVVIKYGGNAMTDEAVRQGVTSTIRRAATGALEPVVVHGGGPFIERELAAAGVESRFVRGLRVTDDVTIELVERALTLLGKRLAQEIGGAVALTGRDANLLIAETFDPDLERVGRVTSLDQTLLRSLLSIPLTPVIACLALDARGRALNVNADDVAGFAAGAMRVPIIFLTNVPGVLDDPSDPSSRLPELSREEANRRLGDGSIAGGMIPKVEAALRALDAGATSAVIADGRVSDGLERALRGEGGTSIKAV